MIHAHGKSKNSFSTVIHVINSLLCARAELQRSRVSRVTWYSTRGRYTLKPARELTGRMAEKLPIDKAGHSGAPHRTGFLMFGGSTRMGQAWKASGNRGEQGNWGGTNRRPHHFRLQNSPWTCEYGHAFLLEQACRSAPVPQCMDRPVGVCNQNCGPHVPTLWIDALQPCPHTAAFEHNVLRRIIWGATRCGIIRNLFWLSHRRPAW